MAANKKACKNPKHKRNKWGSCLDCKKKKALTGKARRYRNAYMSQVWRFKKYGLTKELYEQMIKAQGGRCALCGTDTPGGRFNLWHIDHDHDTGKVRGLLCCSCNLGLGNLRESPDLLRRAADYLEAA